MLSPLARHLAPALLCAMLAPFAAASGADAPPAAVPTMSHGIFDDVPIYRPAGTMAGFALLLSGDKGWDAASQDMARTLAGQGTMVVGIDTPRLQAKLAARPGDCTFPDGDMENLARFIQAYEKVPGYFPPVMVGQQTGASLAYALHDQPETPARFAGLVTVDFSPTLPIAKPLCRGEGTHFRTLPGKNGVELLPAGAPPHPWIALQTAAGPKAAASFLARVPGVQVRKLSGSAALLPALAAGMASLNAERPPQAAPVPASVADLPIVEVPATGTAQSDTFSILLSGDGGWADLDKDVAVELAKDGVPVVGIDSLRYFWTARTPDSVAADVDRLIRFYSHRWKRGRVLLIGYSQGADVLPFVINRLPEESLRHVALAVLMGLGKTAAFKFQIANWLTAPANGLPIKAEADKMPAGLALCIYGEKEAGNSTCPELDPQHTRSLRLPGDHHFDRDYAKLARLILEASPHR